MRVLHAIDPEDFERTDVVLLAGWHIEAAAATLRRTINVDSVKRGTIGQLAPEIGRAGLVRAYGMDAQSAIIAQVRHGTCAVLWPNLRRIRRLGSFAFFSLDMFRVCAERGGKVRGSQSGHCSDGVRNSSGSSKQGCLHCGRRGLSVEQVVIFGLPRMCRERKC